MPQPSPLVRLQSRDDAITRVRDPEIRELLYAYSSNFSSLQQESSRLRTLISQAAAAIAAVAAVAIPAAAVFHDQTLTTASTAIADPYPSAVVEGQLLVLTLSQDATGGRTITWSAAYESGTTTDIAPDSLVQTRFLFARRSGIWVPVCDPMREAL